MIVWLLLIGISDTFCVTDELKENGQLQLKNNLLEAVVDEAGRIMALHVAGSKKYVATKISLLYFKY